MTDQLGRLWWWVTHFELGLPESLMLVISVVTLLIILFQVRLMLHQRSLMKEQLDIVKKQDEILSAERARRAVLEIKVELPTDTHGIKVFVKNSGTKTAKNFYWHLLVPPQILQYEYFKLEGTTDVGGQETLQIEGGAYRHFKGFAEKPLYPTRSMLLGVFVISHTAAPGVYSMFWSTVTEDGANPPEGQQTNRSVFTIGRINA